MLVRFSVSLFLNHSAITVFLRTICGVSIIPLEYICVIALCIVVVNPIVFGTKIVSVRHPRTNEMVRVGLSQVMNLPKRLIFDDKVQEDHKRLLALFHLSSGFGFMYVSTRVFFLSISLL